MNEILWQRINGVDIVLEKNYHYELIALCLESNLTLMNRCGRELVYLHKCIKM